MTHFGAKEFKGDPFHELKKKQKTKNKKQKIEELFATSLSYKIIEFDIIC